MFAIEAKELTKTYGGLTVVDHLNLQIPENTVFGLLGPNGAGKTTTILMLFGMTEPTSGTARVGGFDSTREPLKVKRIAGYMPEKVGFYDNLTARENLDLIAQLNHIDYEESQKRIKELLKAVGLSDVADKEVGKFSRGMKQRLGIADVLIKNPKVAFLDEPTAGLDPDGIHHILQLLGELPQKMGTTIIMSSHRLYEVQRICQRIGILSKGKIVVEGDLNEVGRRAMAGGRFRIEIETGEPPAPELVQAVQKVPGVTGVETRGNTLVVSAESDLRKELSRVVVAKDCPLVQIKIQEFSLDDIYMKYFHEAE